MVDTYLRQSPLAHLKLGARTTPDAEAAVAGVRMCEHPHRGQINLRGNRARKPFRDAVDKACGLALPYSANTVAGADDLADGPRALWLGPDEWLLACAPGSQAALAGALERELDGQQVSVTDLSEARTVIALAGPRARQVLSKGCSLDLHPKSFAPGHCTQSPLAHLAVIIHHLAFDGGGGGGGSQYEIYIARSFAEFLWRWLEDAGAEYAIAITGG